MDRHHHQRTQRERDTVTHRDGTFTMSSLARTRERLVRKWRHGPSRDTGGEARMKTPWCIIDESVSADAKLMGRVLKALASRAGLRCVNIEVVQNSDTPNLAKARKRATS